MNEAALCTAIPGLAGEQARLILGNPEFAGIRVRNIEADDFGSGARRAWLARVLRGGAQLDLGCNAELLLSRAGSDYDVVLFGGDDAAALRAFMARHHQLMRGKSRICLCTAATHAQRADLIAAGFDAVFVTGETHPGEFAAHLFAIWRRYRDSRIQGRAGRECGMMVERAAQAVRLAPKQRAILCTLLSRPGLEVDYAVLAAAAGDDRGPIGLQNLKVLISQLRKLLRPGFEVRHVPGSGYCLAGPQADWLDLGGPNLDGGVAASQD